MAGILAHVNSGSVALVASTAKSVLQLKSPANQRLLVRQLRFFGEQAAGGTDAVVKIRATRNSANFGTFSSATPGKNNPSDGETLQATCGSNATVEPTTPTDTGLAWRVQPQIGVMEYLPLTAPIEVPGGQSIQFECTSTGTPTMMLQVSYEE